MPEIGEFNEIYLFRERGYFGVIPPVMGIVRATDAQTSARFTTPFFRADRPYRVVHGYVRQEVAAADGSLNIVKVPSGTAPASGTSLLASTVNLTTAANTDTEVALAADTKLATGDGIAMIASGTLANLQGVTAALTLEAI